MFKSNPSDHLRLRWPSLKPGDGVSIVAPGFKCKQGELKGAIQFVESLGLRPFVPKPLFAKHHLLSAPDSIRWGHFKGALEDPQTQAIWCVRAGYGAIRLLPQLSQLKRPEQIKVLLGYSDTTTLHAYVNQHWDWPSLHAPLLDRLGAGKSPQSEVMEVKRILFGQNQEAIFGGLRPENEAARKWLKMSKRLQAVVCGGNLTVIGSSVGTPWSLKTNDRFLFLEDIGERPHRVDRMLTQLGQAGFFFQTKAVLLGDFLHHLPEEKRRVWRVLRDWAEAVPCPVFSGLPVGHGLRQRTLPLGTSAILTGETTRARLVVQTGCQA